MPRIFFKYKSLTIALLFSTAVTFCFSFLTGIILNVIDKFFRKQEVRLEKKEIDKDNIENMATCRPFDNIFEL